MAQKFETEAEVIEEIEKIKQQSSKSKSSSSQSDLSRHQVEQIIEVIQRRSNNLKIELTDDILIAILDYYGKQRGPIVATTRSLYRRVVQELIDSNRKQTVHLIQSEKPASSPSPSSNPDMIQPEIEDDDSTGLTWKYYFFTAIIVCFASYLLFNLNFDIHDQSSEKTQTISARTIQF